jgi:glycerol-3-phosphate acyltransferase PlsY
VIVAVLVGAYLLGSIPFSFVVARLFGVADVRRVGSGNVGATNVMRSAGVVPGLIAFALDTSKGAVATAVAARLSDDPWLPALAAVGSVLGHVFPVWLGFRGGKGAATGAGAFVPLVPWASLGAFVVFGLVLALTRYVSLGSIAGAFTLAVLLPVLGAPAPVAWAGLLLAAVVVAKHHQNIRRLWSGSESRMGARRA